MQYFTLKSLPNTNGCVIKWEYNEDLANPDIDHLGIIALSGGNNILTYEGEKFYIVNINSDIGTITTWSSVESQDYFKYRKKERKRFEYHKHDRFPEFM